VGRRVRSGQGQERPARDGGAANTETRAVHWSPGASQGLVDVRTSGQREDAPGPRPGGGGQQQLDQHQLQPTIIFIDEIDALLSERRSGEHEGVRRIKTEFLLQFEGMTTGSGERIVVVAATNRPQELDDAALRRFTKRVYVRMPDVETRTKLITQLLTKQGSPLTSKEISRVVGMTEGYTCSDITNLARDAALAPVREFSTTQLATIQPQDIRQIQLQDFVRSSERIRKSLSKEGLNSFEKWNEAFGDVS